MSEMNKDQTGKYCLKVSKEKGHNYVYTETMPRSQVKCLLSYLFQQNSETPDVLHQRVVFLLFMLK